MQKKDHSEKSLRAHQGGIGRINSWLGAEIELEMLEYWGQREAGRYAPRICPDGCALDR
jgi:hypothetical protein